MTTAHKTPLIPILLTCIAYLYFNIGDAAIKYLAAKFHFSQIIVLNCVFIILCKGGYGLWRHGRKAFVMHKPKWVILRAALSVLIAILNVFAFPNIKLAEFYTLVFTSPLWVAVLAAIFLKEKLEKRQIAVILAGFAVILFVFRPGSGLFNMYAVMVLASAFLYSCTMIIMRHMGPKENRVAIITSGSLFSILAVAAFLPAHYIAPTPYEWVVFAMMGILASIGITCITWAFQNAPSAATVAPYHYTQIFWGTLIGYYMFGEIPADRVVIGAVFIIGAGLFLIYDEARIFRRKKAAELIRSGLGQAV